MRRSRPVYRAFKRSLDIALAGGALLFLWPVMGVLWILVRKHMGSPAIFRQERAGLDAEPFHVFKFRSMVEAYDDKGEPLPDAERLTPFGRFLRRSSLDELPQLWNVLKGDMSLVGPRPLYMEYVPYYSPEQRRRLDVKPGVTGLAQITGRTTLNWEQRLALDIRYVDRASLSVDISIILKTFRKVLGSEDIPESGLDCETRFRGTSMPDEAPATETP
ncbi:sugar transferase [Holophaga foetida]|uniref:sugar transferase n=1 Tax=Holophaga foetida TaxID=35839 RepID=UPI0002473B80|nr:sugar transferase [Holophaga foetida]